MYVIDSINLFAITMWLMGKTGDSNSDVWVNFRFAFSVYPNDKIAVNKVKALSIKSRQVGARAGCANPVETEEPIISQTMKHDVQRQRQLIQSGL